MPTYDYQCKACKHRFEQFQSMKDSALRKCPECGKNTLERLIGTGAAVIFKGSGFYQTDYRSESYKKAAEADAKPAAAASNDSASKPADSAKSAAERPASDEKPTSATTKPEPAKPAKKSTRKT